MFMHFIIILVMLLITVLLENSRIH